MRADVVGVETMMQGAAEFVSGLVPQKERATVVVLSGELGVGKTTFVQGVAKALGIEETVTSPTFVLEKIYKLSEGKRFTRLVHVDAYRLKEAHELLLLGWKELVQDSGNLIMLEWPERVAEAVPQDAIRITLQGSGDSRTIVYGTEKH